uniref:Uncharacterized protein n=1 Tax=Opuntia streptacantha TaxID=393608 RepID=A0A7C8YC23_OPUST
MAILFPALQSCISLLFLWSFCPQNLVLYCYISTACASCLLRSVCINLHSILHSCHSLLLSFFLHRLHIPIKALPFCPSPACTLPSFLSSQVEKIISTLRSTKA